MSEQVGNERICCRVWVEDRAGEELDHSNRLPMVALLLAEGIYAMTNQITSFTKDQEVLIVMMLSVSGFGSSEILNQLHVLQV